MLSWRLVSDERESGRPEVSSGIQTKLRTHRHDAFGAASLRPRRGKPGADRSTPIVRLPGYVGLAGR